MTLPRSVVSRSVLSLSLFLAGGGVLDLLAWFLFGG